MATFMFTKIIDNGVINFILKHAHGTKWPKAYMLNSYSFAWVNNLMKNELNL